MQELVHEDFDRRIEFCELIEARGNDFVNNIVFPNEIHGNVNRQNFRYWNTDIPYCMRNNKSQYPYKVNIWAEIIGDYLIGPFFIDGNLNSEMYETMLTEQIIPAIRDLFSNNFDCVWFQQDEIPAHFGFRVRKLLDGTISNRRTEWLSRSFDLTN